ncbi:transposase [Streptomyces spiralis]|uniref:transposase n=1 Tax=Streptomyces spiralis TaxID=66376 RepID=UPI0036C28C6E
MVQPALNQRSVTGAERHPGAYERGHVHRRHAAHRRAPACTPGGIAPGPGGRSAPTAAQRSQANACGCSRNWSRTRPAAVRFGAVCKEHTGKRTALRDGRRHKMLSTQAGELDLAILELRSGSCFPALLQRRRRIGQALYVVFTEAYCPRRVHAVGRQPAQVPWHGPEMNQERGRADLPESGRPADRIPCRAPGPRPVPVRVLARARALVGHGTARLEVRQILRTTASAQPHPGVPR